MQSDHVSERVYNAVEALATGSGSLRERLRNAVMGLLPLRPEEFATEDQRSRFELIIHWSTRYSAPDPAEGDLAHTLRISDDERVSSLASHILELLMLLVDFEPDF